MVFGSVTSRNKKPYHGVYSHPLHQPPQQRQPYHRGGGSNLHNTTYRSHRNTYKFQTDSRKQSCFRTLYTAIVLVVAILGTVYFSKSFDSIGAMETLGRINDLAMASDKIPPADTTIPIDHETYKSVPQGITRTELSQGDPEEDTSEDQQHPHGLEEKENEQHLQDHDSSPRQEEKQDKQPHQEDEDNAVAVLPEKLRKRDTISTDDDTNVIPDVRPELSAKNDPILNTPVEPIVDSLDQAPHDEAIGDLPQTIPPKPFAFTTLEEFERHRTTAELALKKNKDVATLRKVITAYIEPPLQDKVPNTGSRGNFSDPSDRGSPPELVEPLPLRTQSPQDLRKIEYPLVQTCFDLPGKFPIDRGLQIDASGELVVWNVGNAPTPPEFPELEAPYCPVELDPFLPWIHDVFPSQDGSRIEFIAQNKRRCRTGKEYTDNVNRLTPQVALMQSVSVEAISDKRAMEMAPNLWHPNATYDNGSTENQDEDDTPRYRLVPYELASSNGRFTRFICRFHMTTAMDGDASVTVVLGETLSEYPFNYEYINYRKNHDTLLTPRGKDGVLFWASNLHFSCPVPENKAFRDAIANGKTVLSDGTPTVHVDVVPIRTSVRYEEIHLPKDMIGPMENVGMPIFDPVRHWGFDHVVPRVEASGRWANIPICMPPELVDEKITQTDTDIDTLVTRTVTRKLVPNINEIQVKPHFLVGCLWASAEFKTRGKDRGASTDTIDRLKEWIEFHLMVGFDHIYVYDNSGAHTNETSLEETLLSYPGKVTRVDWPSTVCNNNIPAHDSTGERSSQYAAENSCRRYALVLSNSEPSMNLLTSFLLFHLESRFGPFTEWLASFDTDEYFVPMGNYTNLKDVLRDLGQQGTNILSLRSTRGNLRLDHSVVVGQNNDAIEKSKDSTFLEAYKYVYAWTTHAYPNSSNSFPH